MTDLDLIAEQRAIIALCDRSPEAIARLLELEAQTHLIRDTMTAAAQALTEMNTTFLKYADSVNADMRKIAAALGPLFREEDQGD